jgi:hypothetical protein
MRESKKKRNGRNGEEKGEGKESRRRRERRVKKSRPLHASDLLRCRNTHTHHTPGRPSLLPPRQTIRVFPVKSPDRKRAPDARLVLHSRSRRSPPLSPTHQPLSPILRAAAVAGRGGGAEHAGGFSPRAQASRRRRIATSRSPLAPTPAGPQKAKILAGAAAACRPLHHHHLPPQSVGAPLQICLPPRATPPRFRRAAMRLL